MSNISPIIWISNRNNQNIKSINFIILYNLKEQKLANKKEREKGWKERTKGVFQFEGTLSHDDDYAANKLGLAIDESMNQWKK